MMTMSCVSLTAHPALGRHVDADSPTVDARLPDGSRVNAVVRPVAIDGPAITIRKFARDKLKVDDLISFGSITRQMADFLQACVKARFNIIISGGTGSGKTTLLNVMSVISLKMSVSSPSKMPRITTPAGPCDAHGNESCQRRWTSCSQHPRTGEEFPAYAPDRIVVGEVRGGEALICFKP